jgi:hypothetical protein
MAAGIGWNMLLANQSSIPKPTDRRRWRQLLGALEDMKVGWMRMGVIPMSDDDV